MIVELYVFYILMLVLGFSVGSFLNVVIDRIPRGEKVLSGRSYCEKCGTPLPWFDLIPVISFIVLGAKCRKCKAKLSWYYPAIELLTGVLFSAVFYWLAVVKRVPLEGFQFSTALFYWLVIFSFLIAIFFVDLKYGIIPNKLIFPAAVFSLFFWIGDTSYRIWFLYHNLSRDSAGIGKYLLKTNYFNIHSGLMLRPLIFTILSSLAVFLFFYALLIITKGRGIGGGDVKYSILMGLVTGWPAVISSVFLSFLTGSLVSLILVIIGKKKLKQTIPFGPFLVVGTIIGIFFGNGIIEWYLNLL